MTQDASDDPHWDLVVEIAAKLWVFGQYVAELNPSPTQRFVDLQWAARQAGRVLGGTSKVTITRPRGRASKAVTVTVTVSYSRSGEPQAAMVEERLESLLRRMLAEQGG